MRSLMAIMLLYIVYDYLSSLDYNYLSIDINSINIRYYWLQKLSKKIKHAHQTTLTVYSLLYISLLLCLFSGALLYGLTLLLVPSLVVGLLFGCIPYLYIDLKAQLINKTLSLDVSQFISILARWAVVKEDIYYCFEKSLDQIDGPLKLYVEDFILQVRYSGHIGYAFDIVIQSTHHEMLRTLMINLQQTTYSKGDLQELLERLEEESYQILGEHERRKTETYFDIVAIYFSIACVLLMTVVIFIINVQMRNFYLYTALGQYMMSVFSILFFIGVYIASKITTFNY